MENDLRESELYNMILKDIIKSNNFFLAKGLLESGCNIPKGESYTLLNTIGNTILKGIEKDNIEYLRDQFLKCGYEMDFVKSDSEYINPINSKISEYDANWRERQKNAIKCPTCGSINTEKISTTSKVVGAAAFGIFSKTARSQFKCNHCGYKW